MENVRIRMTADAQGYKKGDELEVGYLRACRWCDRDSIAERVEAKKPAKKPARAVRAAEPRKESLELED